MLPVNFSKLATFKNFILFVGSWSKSTWVIISVCSLLIFLLVRNDRINTARENQSKAIEAALIAKKGVLSVEHKAQIKYVQRFAKVAQNEMNKYGIPASIKLAQGILESNAGKSPLATKNNNHFGIKCFSRTCKKGHCRNFSDDSHKDFFRVYPSAWESFRAHSKFLQGKRYKHLLGEEDYRVWAKGLIKAGYATDKRYADKLIRLIEGLELYRYDVPS